MPHMDAHVTQNDDGTWDFECPGYTGNPCGPWTSTGWPTKKTAVARGQHHIDEHESQTPMPSLDDFRAEHGLTVNPDGSVSA